MSSVKYWPFVVMVLMHCTSLFAAETELPLQAQNLAEIEADGWVEGLPAAAWNLKQGGKHYRMILSRTGAFRMPFDAPEANERSARLFATLYVEGEAGWQQQWQIKDFVEACPLDLSLRFTNAPFVATDLDADGEPEFWVSYFHACRGDVSPAGLKLIGYEGTQKFAMRGDALISYEEQSYGGEGTADAALKSAPKAFQAFAAKRWLLVRKE
jgi:hypothetical protein